MPKQIRYRVRSSRDPKITGPYLTLSTCLQGCVARLCVGHSFEYSNEVSLLHLASTSKTQEIILRDSLAQGRGFARAFLELSGFPSVFSKSGPRSRNKPTSDL